MSVCLFCMPVVCVLDPCCAVLSSMMWLLWFVWRGGCRSAPSSPHDCSLCCIRRLSWRSSRRTCTPRAWTPRTSRPLPSPGCSSGAPRTRPRPHMQHRTLLRLLRLLLERVARPLQLRLGTAKRVRSPRRTPKQPQARAQRCGSANMRKLLPEPFACAAPRCHRASLSRVCDFGCAHAQDAEVSGVRSQEVRSCITVD